MAGTGMTRPSWTGLAGLVLFVPASAWPDTAAKVLVPKSARESPLFKTLSASVLFLGGMNLAFSP